MPFPYQPIPHPAGDWRDPFDNQAIDMCVAHNAMIRGLNAIHAQARGITPVQVEPFSFFCVSFCEMVHAHHHLEETYVFGVYESKLGAGAMAHNVEQHHSFMVGLDALEEYVKAVHAGAEPYSGDMLIAKMEAFTDQLVEHLTDEILTLDKERMRAAFTRQDFKDMEAGIVKHVFKDVSLWTTLPMGLLCHEKATALYFPPLPKALLLAVQYGFARRYSDAWAFAPCDIFGNLKPGLGNEPGVPQM
ncbi:hypothetical protein DFH09DRAFT_1307677 [Mycena vulgaris]|nr:hypothetical protein DFH09DRAFT_1307677 [Mycena vulgaris]